MMDQGHYVVNEGLSCAFVGLRLSDVVEDGAEGLLFPG